MVTKYHESIKSTADTNSSDEIQLVAGQAVQDLGFCQLL